LIEIKTMIYLRLMAALVSLPAYQKTPNNPRLGWLRETSPSTKSWRKIMNNFAIAIILLSGISLNMVVPSSSYAESVTICNDSGDTCIMHKTLQQTYQMDVGSFENPLVDEFPEGYPSGYLHAGMYCAGGNWHSGWLKPWEQAPVIKPSCGR
jgi:hypothetical protein